MGFYSNQKSPFSSSATRRSIVHVSTSITLIILRSITLWRWRHLLVR